MTTKGPFSAFLYSGLKMATKTGFDLVIFFFLIQIAGATYWIGEESESGIHAVFIYEGKWSA